MSLDKIVGALEKAASVVTTAPTGWKVPVEDTTAMVVSGECLGKVVTTPDSSTPIGDVSGFKVSAPPEDPNREPLNPWVDMPPWLASGDL